MQWKTEVMMVVPQKTVMTIKRHQTPKSQQKAMEKRKKKRRVTRNLLALSFIAGIDIQTEEKKETSFRRRKNVPEVNTIADREWRTIKAAAIFKKSIPDEEIELW
eukprot:12759471-Ditylum_brightwellii.AAC.1